MNDSTDLSAARSEGTRTFRRTIGCFCRVSFDPARLPCLEAGSLLLSPSPAHSPSLTVLSAARLSCFFQAPSATLAPHSFTNNCHSLCLVPSLRSTFHTPTRRAQSLLYIPYSTAFTPLSHSCSKYLTILCVCTQYYVIAKSNRTEVVNWTHSLDARLHRPANEYGA
jgi:hypothetical protein